MTKDEIKQLVISFLSVIKWNVPVNFLNRSEAIRIIGDDASPMMVNDVGLFIALDYIVSEKLATPNKIKMSLLHEMGHTHHQPNASLNEGEYMAQMWALGKAYQLICEAKETPDLVTEVKDQIYAWKRFLQPEYRYVYNRTLAENLI